MIFNKKYIAILAQDAFNIIETILLVTIYTDYILTSIKILYNFMKPNFVILSNLNIVFCNCYVYLYDNVTKHIDC